MQKRQRLLLTLCGACSALGVLLCILRVMYWEQSAAVCIGKSGFSGFTDEVYRAAGLYVGTILLLIGTAILAARIWNQRR